MGQDCILFVSDFAISKPPSSNGKKFYIDSTPTAGSSSTSIERKGSARTAFRKVKMLVGEGKPRFVTFKFILRKCYLDVHHLNLIQFSIKCSLHVFINST